MKLLRFYTRRFFNTELHESPRLDAKVFEELKTNFCLIKTTQSNWKLLIRSSNRRNMLVVTRVPALLMRNPILRGGAHAHQHISSVCHKHVEQRSLEAWSKKHKIYWKPCLPSYFTSKSCDVHLSTVILVWAEHSTTHLSIFGFLSSLPKTYELKDKMLVRNFILAISLCYIKFFSSQLAFSYKKKLFWKTVLRD